MQGWSRDLRDRGSPDRHAGHFDVIVNRTCTRHVRMDDVDHGHHSWLIVRWAMFYVVSYTNVRPDREAQRVALHSSRGSQASFGPLKLSPNQRDERREEDHLTGCIDRSSQSRLCLPFSCRDGPVNHLYGRCSPGGPSATQCILRLPYVAVRLATSMPDYPSA